jgi:S-formylglutathione hydrolase FrmB
MRLRLSFAPAFLAVVLPAGAAAFAADPAPVVKTVEFESKSVGRKMKYNVVLPKGYDAGSERYPVLYLLHGYSGDYTNWSRLKAPETASGYDLIVVMPDAGNSWYVNWPAGDDGRKDAWEDAIAGDLVEHVDATYRTIARREGRAINGLSMGGYGALMLGLRRPDVFASAGSHSGAVGFAKSAATRMRDGAAGPDAAAKAKAARKLSEQPNPRIGIEGFSSQAERSPKGRPFAKAEDADAHDPFKLALTVSKDRLPQLYIDCGTDDRLIGGNRDLAKTLMEANIPFTYAETPGGHTGEYWSRMIRQSMAVQYQALRAALARTPAPASSPSAESNGFTTIFDGSTLAGWHVSSKTGHGSGGRWVAADGAIVGSQDKPGNGGILITDKAYRDFEVVVEMNNDFGPDSGLFLRSNERGQAYQAMIDYHSNGNLMGVYGEGLSGGVSVRNFDFLETPDKIRPHDAPTPLPVAPADWPKFWKPGQWNELRARIVGNPPTVTTWINGVKFIEFTDSERRHDDAGGVALQVHGGGDTKGKFVRYRNVRVKELNPK